MLRPHWKSKAHSFRALGPTLAVTSHLRSAARKAKGKRNQPIAGPGTAGSASTTRPRADAGSRVGGAVGRTETRRAARTRVGSEGEPWAVGRGPVATAAGTAQSSGPDPQAEDPEAHPHAESRLRFLRACAASI